MTTLTERVARAICAFYAPTNASSYVEQHWPEHIDVARAAIEAMREPTEWMTYAGDDARDHLDNRPHPFIINNADYIYQAMIDAALKEKD